jgi:hypothetical protein
MIKPLQYTIALCVVALTAGAIYGGMGLTRIIYTAFEEWGNAAPGPALAKLSATLDQINAPCVGFHGSVTCGVLAQAAQTEKNIGIVAGQSALQVKQSGVLVQAAAASVQSAALDVHTVATSLAGTATAATGTLAAITGDVQALKPSLDAMPRLLAAYTRTGDDLDGVIRDNSASLHLTLENVQEMTSSSAAILANGKIVTDKVAHDYTTPVKWYKQPGKIITLGFDAALLAK